MQIPMHLSDEAACRRDQIGGSGSAGVNPPKCVVQHGERFIIWGVSPATQTRLGLGGLAQVEAWEAEAAVSRRRHELLAERQALEEAEWGTASGLQVRVGCGPRGRTENTDTLWVGGGTPPPLSTLPLFPRNVFFFAQCRGGWLAGWVGSPVTLPR